MEASRVQLTMHFVICVIHELDENFPFQVFLLFFY